MSRYRTLISLLLLAMVLPSIARAEKQLNIYLLIDVSGSMKKTDPKGFRKEAASLIVGLASEKDRVQVTEFSTEAKTTCPMSLAGSGEAQKAIELVGQSGQWTNIEKGLRHVLGHIEKNRAAGNRGRDIVVLLSDGMVDLPDKKAIPRSRMAITGEVADRFAGLSIPVFTVALTQNADTAVLRQLAETTVDTNYSESFFFAPSSDELVNAFADIMRIASQWDNRPTVEIMAGNKDVTIDNIIVNPLVDRALFIFTWKDPKAGSTEIEIYKPTGEILGDLDPRVKILRSTRQRTYVVNGDPWVMTGKWRAIIKALGKEDKVKFEFKPSYATEFRLAFKDLPRHTSTYKPLLVQAYLNYSGDQTAEAQQIMDRISKVRAWAKLTFPDGSTVTRELNDEGRRGDAERGDGVLGFTFDGNDINRKGSAKLEAWLEGEIAIGTSGKKPVSYYASQNIDVVSGLTVINPAKGKQLNFGKIKSADGGEKTIEMASSYAEEVRIAIKLEAIETNNKTMARWPDLTTKIRVQQDQLVVSPGPSCRIPIRLVFSEDIGAGDYSGRIALEAPGEERIYVPFRIHVLSWWEIWRKWILLASAVVVLIILVRLIAWLALPAPWGHIKINVSPNPGLTGHYINIKRMRSFKPSWRNKIRITGKTEKSGHVLIKGWPEDEEKEIRYYSRKVVIIDLKTKGTMYIDKGKSEKIISKDKCWEIEIHC